MPNVILIKFVVAVVIFSTGAIGFEILVAIEAEKYGYYSSLYTLLYTIEENPEMFALICLIGASMELLKKQDYRIESMMLVWPQKLRSY